MAAHIRGWSHASFDAGCGRLGTGELVMRARFFGRSSTIGLTLTLGKVSLIVEPCSGSVSSLSSPRCR